MVHRSASWMTTASPCPACPARPTPPRPRPTLPDPRPTLPGRAWPPSGWTPPPTPPRVDALPCCWSRSSSPPSSRSRSASPSGGAAFRSVGPEPTPAYSPSADRPDWRLLDEAYDLLDQHYVDPTALDPLTLERGAIIGLTGSVDDRGHTGYLTPDEVKARDESLSGTFVGVGAVLDQQDGADARRSRAPRQPRGRGGHEGGRRDRHGRRRRRGRPGGRRGRFEGAGAGGHDGHPGAEEARTAPRARSRSPAPPWTCPSSRGRSPPAPVTR